MQQNMLFKQLLLFVAVFFCGGLCGCKEARQVADLTKTMADPRAKGPMHERLKWKAEDFFTDKGVIKLCKAIEASHRHSLDFSTQMTTQPTTSQPKHPRSFHVVAKPVGSRCNLDCTYCYYHYKESAGQISDELLEKFVRQYIAGQEEGAVIFNWHGGEPALLGLDFFRKVALTRKAERVCYWLCQCPAGWLTLRGLLIRREHGTSENGARISTKLGTCTS
jgi:uncharacterized protein